MLINIITACSRPENLDELRMSINIPKQNYRWIVVFDFPSVDGIDIPYNCEYYLGSHPDSVLGNYQKNVGLDKVTDGWVYFLDDDTTLHQDFYKWVSKYPDSDFISFRQKNRLGEQRCDGKVIEEGHIDAGSVCVHHSIIKGIRLNPITRNNADVYWSTNVIKNSTNHKWIPYSLSVYNHLRDPKLEPEWT
jgi:hypothetical protein